MPLDTSSYSLALLRLDGRRWNELRRLHGQISTQSAADGSAFLEMGNTKVMCTVSGPFEARRAAGGGTTTSGQAKLDVSVALAPFAGVERRKRGRTDKRSTELAYTVESAFSGVVFANLYPHSTVSITLNVLAADGSLLAALLNATTLALADAGIPMRAYVAAVSAGSASSYAANDDEADPLLDLNALEEAELPSLTVATVGGSDEVVTLVMETRVQASRLEGMLAVGVDGCRQVKGLLDAIVRTHAEEVLRSAPS